MKRFWLGLMLAMIIGVFYTWLQAPEWLENWNSEHQALVEQQRTSGAEFGRNSDQQGCFDSALQRIEACQQTEYNCTISGGFYLKACWQQSLPSDNFCAGVPAFSDEMSEDDKAWIKDSCFELGATAKGCRLLMKQKMQHCSAG